jgi:hypothetical protein
MRGPCDVRRSPAQTLEIETGRPTAALSATTVGDPKVYPVAAPIIIIEVRIIAVHGKLIAPGAIKPVYYAHVGSASVLSVREKAVFVGVLLPDLAPLSQIRRAHGGPYGLLGLICGREEYRGH